MTPITSTIRRFFAEQDGLTATEYAILLALVIVVVIGTLRSLGHEVNGVLQVLNAATADDHNLELSRETHRRI